MSVKVAQKCLLTKCKLYFQAFLLLKACNTNLAPLSSEQNVWYTIKSSWLCWPCIHLYVWESSYINRLILAMIRSWWSLTSSVSSPHPPSRGDYLPGKIHSAGVALVTLPAIVAWDSVIQCSQFPPVASQPRYIAAITRSSWSSFLVQKFRWLISPLKYSPDLKSAADECLTPSNILPPDKISWKSYMMSVR